MSTETYEYFTDHSESVNHLAVVAYHINWAAPLVINRNKNRVSSAHSATFFQQVSHVENLLKLRWVGGIGRN